MQKIEDLHVVIDIANSNCELNHGPNTTNEDYPAVNAIILPIGHKESEIKFVEDSKFFIPICQECLDGLTDPEWVLMVCLECCSSQWIYKPTARMNYYNKKTEEGYNIIWLKGCPKCGGNFNGFYCG